jgi:RND family efflux transporter MFP subunit
LDDRDLREQLASAEVQLRQAETEHRRTQQLFEAKAATEQAMTAAASALRSAQSQHAHMQVLLTYANLAAPIDGIVTDRRIEKGDLAAAGQVLMSVYDPFRLRLEAPVPLRLLSRLSMDQLVHVRIDYPTRQLKGVVTGIVSEIDPASRTQLVKIRLDNTAGDLPPGGFGRLLIPDTPRPAIFVPATALVRAGQLEYIEIVQNGRVMRRFVQAGPTSGDGRIEILSGLQAGEVYLINPALKE